MPVPFRRGTKGQGLSVLHFPVSPSCVAGTIGMRLLDRSPLSNAGQAVNPREASVRRDRRSIRLAGLVSTPQHWCMTKRSSSLGGAGQTADPLRPPSHWDSTAAGHPPGFEPFQSTDGHRTQDGRRMRWRYLRDCPLVSFLPTSGRPYNIRYRMLYRDAIPPGASPPAKAVNAGGISTPEPPAGVRMRVDSLWSRANQSTYFATPIAV